MLADERGGPVLDLACGSGRILAPLVRDGHVVVGLDLSRAMLGAAARRLRRLPTPRRRHAMLVRADLRAFAFRRRFPLIIAAFHSVQHLITDGDLLRLLRGVPPLPRPGRMVRVRHLRPQRGLPRPSARPPVRPDGLPAPRHGAAARVYRLTSPRRHSARIAHAVSLSAAQSRRSQSGRCLRRSAVPPPALRARGRGSPASRRFETAGLLDRVRTGRTDGHRRRRPTGPAASSSSSWRPQSPPTPRPAAWVDDLRFPLLSVGESRGLSGDFP